MTGRDARWRDAALRLLALVARPVRRAQGRGGVVVEPHRGCGSDSEAFLIGRVFRRVHAAQHVVVDDLGAHMRDIGRRIHRRSIARAPVTVRMNGTTAGASTESDGCR